MSVQGGIVPLMKESSVNMSSSEFLPSAAGSSKFINSDEEFTKDDDEKKPYSEDILCGMDSKTSSFRTATFKDLCFKYDVLLIYDPDYDFYKVKELMPYIERQNLRIFDFARDFPPGIPKSEFFASALKECKYTCIVVTRNFEKNFWLKFRTDMAIQDMLHNKAKEYSVIVVVMDQLMKQLDLPLDLQTISPIFRSERYFKERISKAFAGNPFATNRSRNDSPSHSYSSQPTLAQPSESNHSSSSFDPDSFSCSDDAKPSSKQFVERSVSAVSTQTSIHNHHSMTSHTPSVTMETDILSCDVNYDVNSTVADGKASKPSMEVARSRTPQEHADSPPPSYNDQPCDVSDYKRLTSYTRTSNGCRQPTEVDESLCVNNRPSMTSLPESMTDDIYSSTSMKSMERNIAPSSFIFTGASQPLVSIKSKETSQLTSGELTSNTNFQSLNDIEIEISSDEELPMTSQSPPVLSQTQGMTSQTCETEAQSSQEFSDPERNNSFMDSIKRSFDKIKSKFT